MFILTKSKRYCTNRLSHGLRLSYTFTSTQPELRISIQQAAWSEYGSGSWSRCYNCTTFLRRTKKLLKYHNAHERTLGFKLLEQFSTIKDNFTNTLWHSAFRAWKSGYGSNFCKKCWVVAECTLKVVTNEKQGGSGRWQMAGLVAQSGRTGGAVCKVSYSLARATGRSWVQAPAAFLARLGKKYLFKSLMMSTLHSASVLDKPPWV